MRRRRIVGLILIRMGLVSWCAGLGAWECVGLKLGLLLLGIALLLLGEGYLLFARQLINRAGQWLRVGVFALQIGVGLYCAVELVRNELVLRAAQAALRDYQNAGTH